MYPSLKSLCDEYDMPSYYVRDSAEGRGKKEFGFSTTYANGHWREWHWYTYEKPEERMMQVATIYQAPSTKQKRYKKKDDPYYQHKKRE
jgi:hypothetical protein